MFMDEMFSASAWKIWLNGCIFKLRGKLVSFGRRPCMVLCFGLVCLIGNTCFNTGVHYSNVRFPVMMVVQLLKNTAFN